MASEDSTPIENTSKDNTPSEALAESTPRRSTARHVPAQAPNAAQLEAARLQRWHQDDKPLLTHDSLREWITRCGLVAYGPRAAQLGAPAPSILAAVQGTPLDPETPPASTADARALLTRLIAEGSVVPLNLLGATGGLATDVPDFVASAAVFSYIFTLRGAKAWKQPPATSGSVKVSPLALAIYHLLEAKVTLSAAELATQLGKEITESAVLRALNELWSQLRVLPLPQPDSSPTQWELASARFTKQIKSGANAGQPSALSAIITLYLGQALAATEDEIETFLSPLAPRSKVRDVLHALLPARQLETLVIGGKTLLHIAGELPTFASPTQPAQPQEESAQPTQEGAPRIRKFAAKSAGRIATGLRAKPSFKSASRSSSGSSASGFAGRARSTGRPAFSPRPPAGDRERRPFRRDREDRESREDQSRTRKPAFDKPWLDDQAARKPRPELPTDLSASGSSPAPSAPRRTFSKPGTFGRRREASAGFDSRPRRTFDRSDDRSARPERPARPEGSSRPGPGGFKRENARPFADRPNKPFAGKPSGGEPFAGKPFSKPSFGGKPAGFKRDRPDAGASSDAPRKTYRKFDAPRGGKPFRKFDGAPGKPAGRPAGRPTFHPDRSGESRPPRSFPNPSFPDRSPGGLGAKPFRPKPAFGGKPSSKPGARPAGKPYGGKPAGKPAFGANKPFTRTGGPGKPGQGGFKPVKRQRPEGNR